MNHPSLGPKEIWCTNIRCNCFHLGLPSSSIRELSVMNKVNVLFVFEIHNLVLWKLLGYLIRLDEKVTFYCNMYVIIGVINVPTRSFGVTSLLF